MINTLLAWLTDPVVVVLISAAALLVSSVAVTISCVALRRAIQAQLRRNQGL